MDAETLRVLEMVQKGQITAEQAAELLDALEAPREAEVERSRAGRRFRVIVSDKTTGRTKVNVSIPMDLVEMGARMGLSLQMKSAGRDGVQMGVSRGQGITGVDLEQIMDAIRKGADGKIFEADVEDDRHAQHVIVFVE